MDSNDKVVLDNQGKLRDLVGHDGWQIARKIFSDKILELQNAFNLEDEDPQKLFIDLKVRKVASTLLFNFLREIEGTAQQGTENTVPKTPSYIYKKED